MIDKSRQPAQRVGVFVDTQNLFYAAKYTYQARVNFGNILRDVVGDRQLVRAIAYGIKSEDGDEQSFFEALEKRGFDVKVKPLQIFFGGAKKGDWDIGIAMDIMRLAGKLDVVILLSGDDDFVDLLEHAVSLGCRTEVAAFGSSCSQKLREAAHTFYELEGKDEYLMQKGKVRVVSRNAPAGSGWKGGLPQADAPVSNVDRLEPGVKVERLEPGVEIVRRTPSISVGTAGAPTASAKTPTVRRPAPARRPRRKRP